MDCQLARLHGHLASNMLFVFVLKSAELLGAVGTANNVACPVTGNNIFVDTLYWVNEAPLLPSAFLVQYFYLTAFSFMTVICVNILLMINFQT